MMKDAYEINFKNDDVPRKLTDDGALGIHSDDIAKTDPFEQQY